MKRTLISQWPSIRVTVNPRTLERIEARAEERALSVSAVVREALDQMYQPNKPLREREELALGSSQLGSGKLGT
jgi:Ribbon-helix-helix protein, copG family